MKKRVFIVLCGLMVLSACSTPEVQETVTLEGPGGPVTVQVEIADTQEERERGLMFRKSLTMGHGMLFVMERESPQSFWMKNTLIPLDILFFTSQGKFVSSHTMLPCEADPCKQYPSQGPALYALETPAGFLATHGIGAGWTLRLE